MKRRRTKLARPSTLERHKWVVEATECQVRAAYARDLAKIDGDWGQRRLPHHVHHHWSWSEIGQKAAECFVVNSSERSMGLWASFKRMVKLPEGRFYRLDYLEIDPDLVGGPWGEFLLGLVCARALELDVDGLLVPALGETAKFYKSIGAEQELLRGWTVDKGLLPFVLRRGIVEEVVEEIYEAYLVS